MGLIFPDAFTFQNGIELSNMYISFADEILHMRKVNHGTSLPSENADSASTGPEYYHATAKYNIYSSKEARMAGKPSIEQRQIGVIVSDHIDWMVFIN